MFSFCCFLPAPILSENQERGEKTPHFPISEIYFVDARKGTLPGHDFLHMIHTSQFSWLSVLEDGLSVAEKSQLLLSAEVKQVAISSSLEVVNCSELSSAPGTHPTRGSGPANCELYSLCSRDY